MKHPRRRSTDIEIVRGTTGRKRKLVLFINGHWEQASQTQTAILACLYDEMGYVVPHERLCALLGHDGTDRKKEIHILRQYMAWVRRILVANKLPYAVAVVPEIGYALCEISRSVRGAK